MAVNETYRNEIETKAAKLGYSVQWDGYFGPYMFPASLELDTADLRIHFAGSDDAMEVLRCLASWVNYGIESDRIWVHLDTMRRMITSDDVDLVDTLPTAKRIIPNS